MKMIPHSYIFCYVHRKERPYQTSTNYWGCGWIHSLDCHCIYLFCHLLQEQKEDGQNSAPSGMAYFVVRCYLSVFRSITLILVFPHNFPFIKVHKSSSLYHFHNWCFSDDKGFFTSHTFIVLLYRSVILHIILSIVLVCSVCFFAEHSYRRWKHAYAFLQGGIGRE